MVEIPGRKPGGGSRWESHNDIDSFNETATLRHTDFTSVSFHLLVQVHYCQYGGAVVSVDGIFYGINRSKCDNNTSITVSYETISSPAFSSKAQRTRLNAGFFCIYNLPLFCDMLIREVNEI